MLSRLYHSTLLCLGLTLSGCAVSDWEVRGYDQPRYYRQGYDSQRYYDNRYRSPQIIEYRVYPVPVYREPYHHHREPPRVYGGWPPGQWQPAPVWRYGQYRDARREERHWRDERHDHRHDWREDERRTLHREQDRDDRRGWGMSR